MTFMAAQIMPGRAEKPFAMNRETWKVILKLIFKNGTRIYTKDKVQQLYLATVVMNIQVLKKHRISWHKQATTFPTLLQHSSHYMRGSTSLFTKSIKKKIQKKKSPICVSHINHTSMHLAWPNGVHKAHFFTCVYSDTSANEWPC